MWRQRGVMDHEEVAVAEATEVVRKDLDEEVTKCPSQRSLSTWVLEPNLEPMYVCMYVCMY